MKIKTLSLAVGLAAVLFASSSIASTDPVISSSSENSVRICSARVVFGTSAEFWLNLQSLYDLRLAQQKARESINDLPTLKGLKSYRKVGFAAASRSISPQPYGKQGRIAYKAEGRH